MHPSWLFLEILALKYVEKSKNPQIAKPTLKLGKEWRTYPTRYLTSLAISERQIQTTVSYRYTSKQLK